MGSCCGTAATALLLTSSFTLAAPQSARHVADIDAFMLKVRSGWEELSRFESSDLTYSGTVVCTLKNSKTDITIRETREDYRVRNSHGCKQVELANELSCRNPDYEFRLKRRDATKGWLLSSADFARRSNSRERPVMCVGYNQLLACPLSAFHPLASALESLSEGQLVFRNPRQLPSGHFAAEYTLTLPPLGSKDELAKLESQVKELSGEKLNSSTSPA
jgi:hypothetical protein